MLAGCKFVKTYLETDVETGTIIGNIRPNHSINIITTPDELIHLVATIHFFTIIYTNACTLMHAPIVEC